MQVRTQEELLQEAEKKQKEQIKSHFDYIVSLLVAREQELSLQIENMRAGHI